MLQSAKGPLGVLTGLTLIAGLVGLCAVFSGLHNVLAISAWIYRAIADFAVITTTIVIFSSFATYGSAVASAYLGWISPPIFVWLFGAGVMDARRKLISDAIEEATAAALAGRQAAAAPRLPPAQPPPTGAAAMVPLDRNHGFAE